MIDSDGFSTLVRAPARILAAPLLAAALLAALGLVIGCDESPSNPGEDRFEFAGSLAPRATATHSFQFAGNAIARITLVALSQTAPPPPDPDPRVLGVGLGIARQSEGSCTPTAGQLSFVVGESILIQLADRGYCLNVTDAGLVPAAGTFAYLVTVENND